MPRGSKPGERRGGRKKGTPNRKNAAIQATVEATGLTPLEVMIDNMRFAYGQAGDVLSKIMKMPATTDAAEGIDAFKELVRMRGMAQECAKDAAPYLHPRLSAVEHTGKDGGPIATRDDTPRPWIDDVAGRYAAEPPAKPAVNGANGATKH